nr:hypothetical protein [Streptomyces graminofaciens]
MGSFQASLTGTGHASRGLKEVVKHLIHECQNFFGCLVINGGEIAMGYLIAAEAHLVCGFFDVPAEQPELVQLIDLRDQAPSGDTFFLRGCLDYCTGKCHGSSVSLDTQTIVRLNR